MITKESLAEIQKATRRRGPKITKLLLALGIIIAAYVARPYSDTLCSYLIGIGVTLTIFGIKDLNIQ